MKKLTQENERRTGGLGNSVRGMSLIPRLIIIIGVIGTLYLGSVFLRAHFWESETEKYFEEAIVDIARPWSTERLEGRASWWLREKSKLSPSEIVSLASNDFGSLIEITDGPECNLQRGMDSYSHIEHTYAICEARLRMEKKSVDMKVRLIQEEGGWKVNDFISIK